MAKLPKLFKCTDCKSSCTHVTTHRTLGTFPLVKKGESVCARCVTARLNALRELIADFKEMEGMYVEESI